MDLHSLRHALGGEIVGKQLLCPGPGHSTADRSLSIKLSSDAPGGFICFSHAGDDWRDCRDHVRQRLGLPEWEPGDEQDRRAPAEYLRAYDISAVESEAGVHSYNDEQRERIERAKRLWNEGVNPRRTPVERYLNEQRMLDLPENLCGNVLRYHPACPWRDENVGRTIFVPALIAAFRSFDTNEITAVHRITLLPNGQKVGRRMFGIAHRTAIKLSAASDTLVIGEGLETCMAAMELGFLPAWALGSVGAISSFPVLDGVHVLTILGEAGAASENAVKLCVPRWHAAGRKVRVVTPNSGCDDLNDELILQKKKAPAA